MPLPSIALRSSMVWVPMSTPIERLREFVRDLELSPLRRDTKYVIDSARRAWENHIRCMDYDDTCTEKKEGDELIERAYAMYHGATQDYRIAMTPDDYNRSYRIGREWR